jgi:hypothetical protein
MALGTTENEGKRLLSRSKWEDDIKMDLNEK